MANDSVVVLSHPTALTTKRFWLGDDGRTKVEPYGQGKYFTAETVPLDGLDDLAALLEVLQTETRSFLVRGEVIPGRNLDRVRRAWKDEDGDPGSFREYPRRWMMIDVDGLDPSLKADWSTPAGCAEAANTLLGLLPMELRVAGHVWQASSSAGQKSGLRMHFWFWLDRPLSQTELERWGEFVNDLAGKKVLDLAVFRTVQPLYVATPVFENVLDPVAQRMGYVPGAPAVLPRTTSRGDGWKRLLEPLYLVSNDTIHEHVRNACASYFCANGPDAPADLLQKALRAAVDHSCSTRGVTDSKYDDARLAIEIESGRQFAGTRAAAGDNLLLDRDGSPKGCIANILAVMQSDDQWRRLLGWNIRAGRIEILRETPWGARAGEWVDARDSVQAAAWFARERRMSVDDGTLLRAAMTYARESELDPVADWLAGLEWDRLHRLDDWLIEWCGAEDCDYTRRVSRMWLIGAVARAMLPGCKNDTVLVLQGDTGIGKSTLLEVIGGQWYAALTEEKDMLQKIHGPWIIELPELGPFRFMHYNRIKSFTSTPVDRFRAPYMRLPEDRPRTCALAATLNHEGVGWQEDATSARRFHPVDVTEIDRVAVAAAREQLFAEAVVAFRAGETWWVVDPKDPVFVAAQNKVFATDAWQTVLTKLLAAGGQGFAPGGRACVIPPDCQEFELADLMSAAFNNHCPSKSDQARAARTLLHMGYTSEGTKWRKKELTAPAQSDKGEVAA